MRYEEIEKVLIVSFSEGEVLDVSFADDFDMKDWRVWLIFEFLHHVAGDDIPLGTEYDSMGFACALVALFEEFDDAVSKVLEVVIRDGAVVELLEVNVEVFEVICVRDVKDVEVCNEVGSGMGLWFGS